MTKHQTFAYIKYGKLISEINDKISDSAIRSDMIKFLVKFPGNLKYPNDIYQPNIYQPISISKKYGKFIFKITKVIPSKFLSIDFDGNNNFEIGPFIEWPSNKSDCFHIRWTSIDNIERYVELYHNDFNDIIDYNE